MTGESNRRIKVFVSSTYEDLKDYRKNCIEVLNRLKEGLGIDYVGMESFGADDTPPRDYCLGRVDGSDIYVGIFGMRYGTVDDETGMSLTELEYRTAKQKRLPCLIYIMDEKLARIAPGLMDTGNEANKLQDLKKELSSTTRGHMLGFFYSPENLASQLSVDLIEAVNRLKGNALSGLRGRIDRAIGNGCRFIREMENQPGGGWSYFAIGDPIGWDTALSLLALAAGDEESFNAPLHRGQHWLIAHRNPYGGWRSPWEKNPDASTTVDTAVSLLALKESGYDEQPGYLKATADYLLGAQHLDGGWSETFGDGPSATAATAWAIRALVDEGLSPAAEAPQRALHWLLSQQWPDGGWGARPWAPCTTIGKTCDALMALSAFGLPQTKNAINAAREWLTRNRSAYSSAEKFGESIGAEPHGVNPTIENILLFLEAAFYAGIPASDPLVKNDLEWIAARRWWSYTPRAVQCLCQYRKWVT